MGYTIFIVPNHKCREQVGPTEVPEALLQKGIARATLVGTGPWKGFLNQKTFPENRSPHTHLNGLPKSVVKIIA